MAERILLASTSPYRRALLARLRLPFEAVTPDFEEATDLPPQELVRHNALGKAKSVARRFPDAAVIASDQVAVCDGTVLGKPGTAASAREQLARLSGRRVEFFTGLALVRGEKTHLECVPFGVRFRRLTAGEIETYVALERPLDCAGSFKSEGLGIALFTSMEGEDPTALVGLPLIRLSQLLRPLERLRETGRD